MMNKLYFFLIGLLYLNILVGCNNLAKLEDTTYLSGYWQIESAELESGDIKEFGFNPLIDYIELSGDGGVRKKLAPKLDGTFITTKSSEKFVLKTTNDSLKMLYTTSFSGWEETILFLDENSLKILNKDGKIFTYKRYEKIEMTTD